MNLKRPFAKLSFAIVFSIMLGAGCLPRQIKPVDSIDPAPLLRLVRERQAAFGHGLSGTMDLAYKNKKQRFNSRVHIVAYPDGRFRMEIPGAFGNTYLFMANDNRKIMAFYPGDNRAFSSAVNSRSLNRQLPFPLPVDPEKIAALIMGVFPHQNGRDLGVRAYLMGSGEKLLEMETPDGNLKYAFLFGKTPKGRLRKITVEGKGVEVSIVTDLKAPNLPRKFEIFFSEGFIKGQWEKASLFEGNDSVLELRIPESTPVTDLDQIP
jgi:hypothetical protein